MRVCDVLGVAVMDAVDVLDLVPDALRVPVGDDEVVLDGVPVALRELVSEAVSVALGVREELDVAELLAVVETDGICVEDCVAEDDRVVV